jgi:DNA-directed RNA polymerase specialized sigma24 family protein
MAGTLTTKAANYSHEAAPGTLKALYQRATGDTATHQRTIDAHFRKLPERPRAMISHMVTCGNYHEVAAAEGISAASAREAILRALERLRKAIADEPRYNRVGRKHPG